MSKTVINTLMLFSTFLLVAFCMQQEETNEDKFLKWYLENNKISNTLQVETINIDSSDIKHILGLSNSTKNAKRILRQISDNNERRFSFKPSQVVKVMNIKEINEAINKTDGYVDYRRMTKPIFIDGLVWIKVEHLCGSLCGSGNIYVYKKTNEGYELIDFKMIWVS